MSRADSQDTALQDVSSRVGDALRARLERSSIGSGGSHATDESYVAVAAVPTGRLTTSRGTLASSRLLTRRSATAQGATGLIGGGLGSSSSTAVPMRQSVPPAGKSMGKGYQRGAEVVEVEDWTRTCRCLFADTFCVMSCLEGKTSCIKTHKGERFSPTEERTYFVPAKPYKNKKMAFTYPSIAHSHIPDDLMPEFSKKKTSKEWKALILSTEAAWEVEQAAILEGNDSAPQNREVETTSRSYPNSHHM